MKFKTIKELEALSKEKGLICPTLQVVVLKKVIKLIKNKFCYSCKRGFTGFCSECIKLKEIIKEIEG